MTIARNHRLFPTSIIILLVGLLPGCHLSTKGQAGVRGDPSLLVPIGTTSSEAMKIMARNGFKCELDQGDFKAQEPEANGVTQERTIENVRFISCHRSSTSRWVATIESVYFVLDSDSVVTHAYKRTQFTGP